MAPSEITPLPAKADLRRTVRAARRARRSATTPEARRAESQAIADAVLAHLDSCPAALAAGWGTPDARVAAFRSTPSEPDTTALLAALHARGATVLVPRTQPDMTLEWHELSPAASERAAVESAASGDANSGAAELPSTDDTDDEGPALGLDAIADITAMIQPGLAVDADGHRLGQGGGCYDRTVPRLREGTCRAVLLFDDELLPQVPVDEHDQPVPALVTPESGWRDLA